ncbi:MAG: dipeptide ABC transporter ATP-binding protein [Hyphomicrobiales bacterium]
MSAALVVEGLTVSLRTGAGMLRAVRGIDLEVARGETLCIVGESGCGKTMTAFALMDLLPQSASRQVEHLRLSGEELKDADEGRLQALRGNRMAMIFQEPTTALNPAYTVGEQIIEGLLQHRPRFGREEATSRAISLLETCGVGQARLRLRQYPHQLSGGLRQRVMIAMALMTEPALLIADEPTTALDVTIRAQILALLDRLRREFALAIILITHDLSVVGRFGQRVAVMYAGEIVETGPTQALLRQPMHPYTRALLSCVPDAVDDGQAGSRLGYLPGEVPSLVGEVTGCQFRNRCSHAKEACAGEIPERALGPGRFYRCVMEAQDAISARHLPAPAAPFRTGIRKAEEVANAARDPMAIRLREVEVRYAVAQGIFARKATLHALRGIDLDLAEGEALGVVGESGGGKSTLAKVILGLEKPSRGEVHILGMDVRAYDRATLARQIQPVFQDPYSSLNPRRSVGATIRLPLDVHGIGTPSERQAEMRRMMDLCGLPARLAASYPSQLSGGQRQRVAIASALILKPRIVLCDEPTSALDVSVQSQILNLLRDLRAELGLTYVIISHDMSVIRFLADRIAVLYLGAIVETGATGDILRAPLHPYSQMLLEATLRPDARAERYGELPDAIGAPSGCAFRTRCPHAMPVCGEITPPLRHLAGRSFACHLDAPHLHTDGPHAATQGSYPGG